MSNYSNSIFSEDPNTPWFKAVDLIPKYSTVLDVGCSSGNFGEVIIDRKNAIVDGIEINEKDALIAKTKLRNVYIANIETEDIHFNKEIYDVIYFGDVIEHLVNPITTLKKVKLALKKDGVVIFSIPNMAHISVRLMLLAGKFEYGDTGLLDKTHIHYYDHLEIERVFNEAGYEIDYLDWVSRDIPKEVIELELKKAGLKGSKKFFDSTKDVNASAYQFIGRAIPSSKIIKKDRNKISPPIDMYENHLKEVKKAYENNINEINNQLKIKTAEVERLKKHIVDYQQSIPNRLLIILKRIFRKLRKKPQLYKKLIDKLIPKNSIRRKLLKRLLIKYHLLQPVKPTAYNTWVYQKNKHPEKHEYNRTLIDKGPLISIIVPTYNTPERYFVDLIYSIVSQSYQNWELIIADASTEQTFTNIINKYKCIDNRINIIHNPGKGISANTNKGIEVANGKYVAFCDHDDILDPWALYEVAKDIVNNDTDIVYTDEDKVSENGEIYFDPHFKPDYSPDLFTHVNYINHFTVVRKKLIDKVGGLNPERDGAQDYDLLLRIISATPNINISHVAKVLYHWRAAHNSTASNFSSKNNITKAAKLSLQEYFYSKNIKLTVTPKYNQPGFYSLELKPPNKIAIILTPFEVDSVTSLYIEMLIKYTNLEGLKVQLILPSSVKGNFSNKFIVSKVKEPSDNYLKDAINLAIYENVVVVNTISIPMDENWIRKLCSFLQLQHIFAVSPVIINNEGIIQDGGLVWSGDGDLIYLFKNMPINQFQTIFGNTSWARDVDVLSGRIIAIKKSTLKQALIKGKDNNIHRTIRSITSIEKKDKYNFVNYDIVMSNLSIYLKTKIHPTSNFSSNLLPINNDYIPYTSTEAAMNILLNYKDLKENPL